MCKIRKLLLKFIKIKPIPKGTSLIEILVVIVISAIIVVALLSLFAAGQKYFANQDARADAMEDSRFPITWMTRDIKEAVQVVPGPVDIGGSSYSTSANCLVLQVPSIDGTGAIIDIDNDLDYIVYQRNSTNTNHLERIIDGKDGVSSRIDSTRIVADDVNSFSLSFFKSDGSAVSSYSETATIDISLSSTRTGIGRTFQEAVNTKVKLRNKAIE